MTFSEIFQQTEVAAAIQPGIQALGSYTHLIQSEDAQGYAGSVDIDHCLTRRYPQDPRWDYVFGFHEHLYYVEVHHVSDSQVSVVIAKYRWLRDWQNRQPNPTQLQAHSDYYWLSSGKGSLTKNSRYTRSLARAGLEYPKKLLRV